MAETVNPLVGLHWKAVVNGRNTLNGERYSITTVGQIAEAAPGDTIYDVLRALPAHLETTHKEMEHPDSFQITLAPKGLKFPETKEG